MSNIIIPNPQSFDTKLQNIIAGWPEKFHVIADFDRTLTKAFIDGKENTSLVSVIQEQGYLWTEFTEQSRKNFDKYRPIEIDPNVSLEEKKKAMTERWKVQFELIIASWISRDIIQKVIKNEPIAFREWHEELFDILHKNNIPLVIMSASGLWYEAIYYTFKKIHKLYDNIDIISNAFIRDEKSKATGVKEPVIHSFNKDETTIKDFPVYKKIKDRKNILLLGDGMGDAGMADGFDYENIIKIWFLNNDTPDNRKKFSETFDLVILDDGDMEEVNKIIKKLVKSE